MHPYFIRIKRDVQKPTCVSLFYCVVQSEIAFRSVTDVELSECLWNIFKGAQWICRPALVWIVLWHCILYYKKKTSSRILDSCASVSVYTASSLKRSGVVGWWWTCLATLVLWLVLTGLTRVVPSGVEDSKSSMRSERWVTLLYKGEIQNEVILIILMIIILGQQKSPVSGLRVGIVSFFILLWNDVQLLDRLEFCRAVF